MNDVVYLKFKFNPEQLVKAYDIHWKYGVKLVWKVFAKSFGFFYLGLGIYFSFRLRWRASTIFLILLLLGIGLFFLFGFKSFRKWRIRRHYKTRPDKDAEVEWQISSDSLKAKGPNFSEAKIQWPAIYRIIATSSGFMIYPNELLFYFWPKEAFASDESYEKARVLMKEKVSRFIDDRNVP